MSYARGYGDPSLATGAMSSRGRITAIGAVESSADVFRKAQAEFDAAQAKKSAEWAARPESKILRAVFIGGLALWGYKVLKKSWKDT